MVHCVVVGCYNTSENSDVSFFRFPKYQKLWKSDKAKMNSEWVTKINRVDKTSKSVNNLWQPNARSLVCSDHFTKDCFTRDPELSKSSGYKQLRLKDAENVIPTLMPVRDTKNKLVQLKATQLQVPKVRPAFAKRQKQSILNEILENDGFPTARDGEDTCTTQFTEREFAHLDLHIPLPTCVVGDLPSGASCDQGIQTSCVKTYVKRTQTDRSTCTNGTQTTPDPPPPKFRSVSTMTDNQDVADVSTTTDASEVHCACCSSHTSDEANAGNDEEIDNIEDEDWYPTADLPSDDESDDSNFDNCPDEIDITNITSEDPVSERKYIVFESCIKDLLSCCRVCNAECSVVIKRQFGTMVTMESRCQAVNSHRYTWSSQPERKRLPVGNLLLCGSILYSGSCVTDILNIFKHLNVSCVSERTYRYLQAYYLIPAVDTVWMSWQRHALQGCEGRDVKLGGDARCSSPGHTAKYGSYSLMDLETGLILDCQLVQATEVTNSNAIELEGLKRGIQSLKDRNVRITDLTTDRHMQVRKYMRTEQSHIRHWFDVWHVSKGVFRKLTTLSKKKGCESIAPWAHSISNHMYWTAASSNGDGQLALEKWSSVANHVVDVHRGHGTKFQQCEHEDLAGRQWILNGSKAHKELKDVVLNGRLLKDVQKLSPAEQTSQLESFHKLICQFAPKFQHFFYDAMRARVLLAVLHNNENAGRLQASKRDGTLKFKVSYPKGKQGEHVVKRVKEDCTYGYVEELLQTAMERRDNFPSHRQARDNLGPSATPILRSKLSKRIDTTTAIQQHTTRFAHVTGLNGI